MSRIEELEGAIKFADEVLEEYEENNESVPKFVYDRMILLYDELIGALKEDTARLKSETEAMKAANKVFESGRSLI